MPTPASPHSDDTNAVSFLLLHSLSLVLYGPWQRWCSPDFLIQDSVMSMPRSLTEAKGVQGRHKQDQAHAQKHGVRSHFPRAVPTLDGLPSCVLAWAATKALRKMRLRTANQNAQCQHVLVEWPEVGPRSGRGEPVGTRVPALASLILASSCGGARHTQ